MGELNKNELPKDVCDYKSLHIKIPCVWHYESDGDWPHKTHYVTNGEKRIDCHNRQHAKNLLKKARKSNLSEIPDSWGK